LYNSTPKKEGEKGRKEGKYEILFLSLLLLEMKKSRERRIIANDNDPKSALLTQKFFV
jgi:hypothetical protein